MTEQINLQDLLSELKKSGYPSTVRNNLVETILDQQLIYSFISDWDRLTITSAMSLDGEDPIAPFIAATETMMAVGFVRIFVQEDNEHILFSVDFICSDLSQVLPCFSRAMEIIKSAIESFKHTMNILSHQ